MDVDIMDMECRLFRMAQKKWHMEPKECEDCYDGLHLSGYQCALDDIQTLLSNQGVVL